MIISLFCRNAFKTHVSIFSEIRIYKNGTMISLLNGFRFIENITRVGNVYYNYNRARLQAGIVLFNVVPNVQKHEGFFRMICNNTQARLNCIQM